MILSRELGKRIWGGSTNIENGGGGVSGDAIAGLLTGYAKESWVDEHYISIDFFSRLFQAHGTENGSEIDVMPNDMDTTITSVESMFGFWTNLYISALGSNGAAPAGISLGMLTDVTISGTPSAGQVLTFDAATQKWVNSNAQAGVTALANLTDVTLTSLQNGQTLLYDSTNSKWYNSALKTINGQSLLGSGDISVGGGASGNYLPLSGGTLTNNSDIQLICNTSIIQTCIVLTQNNVYKGQFGWNTSEGTRIYHYSNPPEELGLNNLGAPFYKRNNDLYKVFHEGYIRNTSQGPNDTMVIQGGSNGQFFRVSNTDIFITDPEWTVSIEMRCLRSYGSILHNGGNLILQPNNYYVGIGTTSPSSKLDVNGWITGNGLTVNDNPNSIIYLGVGGTTKANLSYQSDYGTILWNYVCNKGFCINNNGNFGIRTNSPSYTLHVAGTIYATGSITALSDARKKDITGEADVTVEQIAHAPAVQFLWKDKERRKDGHQVGTLAQYWQTVLPEVVMDKGGELSMQYGVAALVSAIVTARKVVDHERRITELEKENERLSKELWKLKFLN